MNRYLVVSSLQRGIIDPPEPVTEFTQAVMEEQDHIDALPVVRQPLTLRNQEIYWFQDANGIPQKRRIA